MPNILKNCWKKKERALTDLDNKIESIFFNVLEDLKDYLYDLTLVGGWLAHIYLRFLWNNPAIKPVTTVDIDFGFGEVTLRYSQRPFLTPFLI